MSEADKAIASIASEMGLDIERRLEYSLAVGRADAVFNRLVIEYEPPGSLRPSLRHKHTDRAVEQVKSYMIGLADAEGHRIERLLGVVFDGTYYIFVRAHGATMHVEPPVLVNSVTSQRFLLSLFSLAVEKALVPDNLIRDFGGQSDLAKDAIAALYWALAESSPIVSNLFAQWEMFFGEVVGHDALKGSTKHRNVLDGFVETLGIEKEDLDAPAFFFSLHTYFSFITKLIARLALESVAGGAIGGTPLTKLASLTGDALKHELERMEDGGIYRALGIRNLLEGDFFSWYLAQFTDEVQAAFQRVIAQLASYSSTPVQADPFATRDLLKALYHQLLPRQVRHDLGEYYTPDWLAELVIAQLGEPLFRIESNVTPRTESLPKRLLDPACGSGTFLLLALRALKENTRRMGFGESEMLEIALASVVGIDLNPLAVLAARVNYLLAVIDLIPFRKGEVEIPVYLADSVVRPAEGEGLYNAGRRVLKTTVGDLPIPITVSTPVDLAKLTTLLEEHVESGFALEAFLGAAKGALESPLDNQGEDALRDLYSRVSVLHAEGRNGIWARIIKNAFMPLFLSDFDYVVGNPPWINWESLPADYRAQSADLWRYYGLFVHEGMDTILGKSKKDMSTLMTVAVMHQYLKPTGKLAFVITQSVWKATSAAQGFRHFLLPGGTPFRVGLVQDFSNIQVFEGASTKTTTFVARKGLEHRFPVPYTLWQKAVWGVSVGFNSTLDEVTSLTRRLNLNAEPVSAKDATSSWLTARGLASRVLREKVLGRAEYTAHVGVFSGGANGVYWLELLQELPENLVLVRNLTESGKIQVPQVRVPLERGLVYPLLSNSDTRRWSAKASQAILMVQDPATRRGVPEGEMQKTHPKAYMYLKKFERTLRARAAFKRYFTRPVSGATRVEETGPFYSMFNVGE